MRTERCYEAEQRERDSFILLQHMYTITEADPGRVVVSSRIADDLGFCEADAGELIGHLARLGYFKEVPPGQRLALTSQGIEYIERLAWRRHSVRAQ